MIHNKNFACAILDASVASLNEASDEQLEN